MLRIDVSNPADIPRPLRLEGDLARADARILVVVRGAENYGTRTKIIGLLESLEARGTPVRLFVFGEGGFAQAVRAQPSLAVEVTSAAPPRFEGGGSRRLMAYGRTMRASIPFMANLLGYLRRHPCDAIIFCEHGLALPLGAVARLTGTRAFWVMANSVGTGYPFDLNRRIYAFAFRRLGVVPVANSEHTRLTLGRGARYASKIDLGINPDRVAAPLPASPPLTPEAGQGRIRLLVMSRLVESKGHLVLLRAMLSSDAFKDIHLVLCGGPLGTPYVEQLTAQAASHGAGDRLHLVGPVGDVAPYYETSDVVVNCRLDPEPFGLSIVEAMLAGKPVLAHASGGPADIVVDGVTGWHVTSPTVEGFAAGLTRMIQDRARWPLMGEAAAARARRNYTHHTMTDQLLAVIAATCGRS